MVKNMQKKKLIMCDCFGVVSSCVLPPWFNKVFGEIEGPKICKFYCDQGDMGLLTLMDIANIAEKEFKQGKAIDIYNMWIDGTVANKALLDYFDSIRDEYEIVLASNAMEGLVENVFKKHDLAKHFDKLFISYQMKLVKPHLDYYEHIINSYDYRFDEIYMIDDRNSNLEPLKDIGVKGILFHDVEDVKKALNK